MGKEKFLQFVKANALVLTLWGLILLYLCINAWLNNASSVTVDYYAAARQWIDGKNLYDGSGWHFIYFPQSALLYTSLGLLPFKLSEVAWRIILTILLASSLYSFVRLVSLPSKKFFLALTIICFIVATGSLKLGQMNIIIAALGLFSILAIQRQRLNLAAFLLVLSLAYKPTSIVFFLIFFALYSNLRWRLLLVVLIVLLVPFLFQHSSYVIQQYQSCVHNFQHMTKEEDQVGWAQLYGVIYGILHIKISSNIMYLSRIIMAPLTLLMCFFCKKYFSTKNGVILIYTFAAIYLMLFNPRTESNDYIILMPMIVWFYFQLYFSKQHKVLTVCIAIIIFFMMFNHGISRLFHIENNLLRPIGTILFSLILLWVVWFRRSILQQPAIAN